MSGKKPQRLGMGLSALLGDAGTGTASPQALPVAAIEPGPLQTGDPVVLYPAALTEGQRVKISP